MLTYLKSLLKRKLKIESKMKVPRQLFKNVNDSNEHPIPILNNGFRYEWSCKTEYRRYINYNIMNDKNKKVNRFPFVFCMKQTN